VNRTHHVVRSGVGRERKDGKNDALPPRACRLGSGTANQRQKTTILNHRAEKAASKLYAHPFGLVTVTRCGPVNNAGIWAISVVLVNVSGRNQRHCECQGGSVLKATSAQCYLRSRRARCSSDRSEAKRHLKKRGDLLHSHTLPAAPRWVRLDDLFSSAPSPARKRWCARIDWWKRECR
jgi:hypothetical protein